MSKLWRDYFQLAPLAYNLSDDLIAWTSLHGSSRVPENSSTCFSISSHLKKWQMPLCRCNCTFILLPRMMASAETYSLYLCISSAFSPSHRHPLEERERCKRRGSQRRLSLVQFLIYETLGRLLIKWACPITETEPHWVCSSFNHKNHHQPRDCHTEWRKSDIYHMILLTCGT